MSKVQEKIVKGFIGLTEKSLKHNANSTTSAWAYQPKTPAAIEKFKKN